VTPTVRAWAGRATVALVLALVANAILSELAVEHDAALVTLLAFATVAALVLSLEALDSSTRTGWTVRRGDARPESGEDTRTAMYRHVVEVHLSSRDADDAIIWQVADLARQRLRQLHGLRYEDSPLEVAALVGEPLAEWLSHDRRHRYAPGVRHQRYSVDQLAEAMRRVEEL
jgi:hypothetical protein